MLIGVACKSQQSVPLIASQMALQKRQYTLSQNMLRKGGNLNEGLMEYRNTPISNFPYSPNQMLFCWKRVVIILRDKWDVAILT